MGKHLTPLQKEFLITQYRKTRKIQNKRLEKLKTKHSKNSKRNTRKIQNRIAETQNLCDNSVSMEA